MSSIFGILVLGALLSVIFGKRAGALFVTGAGALVLVCVGLVSVAFIWFLVANGFFSSSENTASSSTSSYASSYGSTPAYGTSPAYGTTAPQTTVAQAPVQNVAQASQLPQATLVTSTSADPTMGITTQPADPRLSAQFSMSPGFGATIVSVAAGGPAAQAGLVPGDFVQAMDADPLTASHTLADYEATKGAGHTITLSVEHNNGGQWVHEWSEGDAEVKIRGEVAARSRDGGKIMAERPYIDEFYHNAHIASKHSGPLGILMAVSVKLIQLGVPGAESIREAKRTNFAVVDEACNPRKIEGRNREVQERAMDALAMRLGQLGGQLPPEAADGAFLATKEQVQALVAAGERLTVMEAEKGFFRAALMGSPFDGDVAVIGVMDMEAYGKLISASEHSPVNDILWAMSLKLVELGQADAIIEEDTTDTIHVLAVARDHAARSGDAVHRRRAVDILRTELVRLVGLMPQDVWASDFLDTRAGVLALIGDRAHGGE